MAISLRYIVNLCKFFNGDYETIILRKKVAFPLKKVVIYNSKILYPKLKDNLLLTKDYNKIKKYRVNSFSNYVGETGTSP